MSTDPELSLRKVRCPGCGVDCVYAVENPYRPFCSSRCKNNDFGSWASERFSVDAEAGAGLTDLDSDIATGTGAAEPRSH